MDEDPESFEKRENLEVIMELARHETENLDYETVSQMNGTGEMEENLLYNQ
jgi:hypothetical protein